MSNLTSNEDLATLCPLPWRYQTAEQTHSSPDWGKNHNYAGGGYVADLGYNNDTASGIIDSLELRGWLDRKTRVVILEFAFFNPATNILSVSTYFYERFPTGGALPYTRTRTISLYSKGTGSYQVYLICQLLLILVIFLYFAKECFKLFRQGSSYLKSPWNLLKLAQIVFAVLAVVFYIIKVDNTTKTIRELRKNVYANVSFDLAIFWTKVENGVLAILTFIVCLKLSRLVRFNRQVTVFSVALYSGLTRLISFMLVFLILFMAFLHFGIIIFGNATPRYSTFKHAVYFQLKLTLGKVKEMPINELVTANETFGRVFAGAFLVSLTIVFVNFFIAVINDSLMEAQAKQGIEKEVDINQNTFVKKTKGSSSKLEFDLISEAIRRITPSSSSDIESAQRDTSTSKPHNENCCESSGRYLIDFELVSAVMFASRMKNDAKENQACLEEKFTSRPMQTKLDFAKISEEGSKESTSKKNKTACADKGKVRNAKGKRKVNFAYTKVQEDYTNLQEKQYHMLYLMDKILSQCIDEEDAFILMLKRYTVTLKSKRLDSGNFSHITQSHRDQHGHHYHYQRQQHIISRQLNSKKTVFVEMSCRQTKATSVIWDP